MAKKVRSKEELLCALKTYQALKNDSAGISGSTVYWRMGVEWCAALWQVENFSTNQLSDFCNYMSSQDIPNMTEERRALLRTSLGEKIKSWTLINSVQIKKQKNNIDAAINELAHYNTEKSVDYSLIALDYLINQKGYAHKRLNRVMGNVYYLDNQPASVIWSIRQDLFDQKGIWIELDDDQETIMESLDTLC